MARNRSIDPDALDPDLPYRGLTPKQEQYAQERARGANIGEAYRAVYGADKKSGGTYLEANPKVAARIRELLVKRENAMIAADVSTRITKDYVLNGIVEIAENDERGATRLRAYELLGKGLGLFEPPKDVPDAEARSVAEVDRELKRKLSSVIERLLNGEPKPASDTAKLIEGKAR